MSLNVWDNFFSNIISNFDINSFMLRKSDWDVVLLRLFRSE